jgi:hypothetical protein
LRRRGRRGQRSAAASTCRRRRHWAAALARADPPPIRPHRRPAAQKGPPAVDFGLDVQRCAGVDERIDGRQMAVFRRPVQRRPPIPPVQCKGGVRGRCGPEGTPDTAQPVPIPYPPCGPGGTPVFFFVFRPAGGWGTWGYSPYSGIPPAARAAAPPAETPNRMENRVCEPPGKKSEIWTGWHGNAPVSEAEVLTARTQQSLHATQ